MEPSTTARLSVSYSLGAKGAPENISPKSAIISYNYCPLLLPISALSLFPPLLGAFVHFSGKSSAPFSQLPPSMRPRSTLFAEPEFPALNHESRILGHSSNPESGFCMMEQVRLSAVWPLDNWLGSSLNQIQCWTTVRESYSCVLE